MRRTGMILASYIKFMASPVQNNGPRPVPLPTESDKPADEATAQTKTAANSNLGEQEQVQQPSRPPSLFRLYRSYPEKRRKNWPLIYHQTKKEGVTFPFKFETYEQFEKGIIKEGVYWVSRFKSLKALSEMLQDRAKADDPRPVALVIAARFDHNGALRGQSVYNELKKDGHYRTLYYEAKNEAEYIKIIKQVTHNYTKPVHTLVASVHGSPFSQHYGHKTGESSKVDRRDFAFGDEMAEAINKGVSHQIVLASCRNGFGAEWFPNLHNAYEKAARKGVRILSSRVGVPINGIKIDPKGIINIHSIKNPYITISDTDLEYTTPSLELGIRAFYATDASSGEEGIGAGGTLGWYPLKLGSGLAAGLAVDINNIFEQTNYVLSAKALFYHTYFTLSLQGGVGYGDNSSEASGAVIQGVVSARIPVVLNWFELGADFMVSHSPAIDQTVLGAGLGLSAIF